MKRQIGSAAALIGIAFLLGTAVVGCDKETTTTVPVAGEQGPPGAPGAPGTDLQIDNASFQQGSGSTCPGWWTTGTLSFDSSTPYTGGQSLVTTVTAQYQQVGLARHFAVKPGDTYKITAALKSDGTSLPMAILFVAPGSSWVASAGNSSSSSWVVYTGTGTIPADCTDAYVGVVDTSAGGGTRHFEVGFISVQKVRDR